MCSGGKYSLDHGVEGHHLIDRVVLLALAHRQHQVEVVLLRLLLVSQALQQPLVVGLVSKRAHVADSCQGPVTFHLLILILHIFPFGTELLVLPLGVGEGSLKGLLPEELEAAGQEPELGASRLLLIAGNLVGDGQSGPLQVQHVVDDRLAVAVPGLVEFLCFSLHLRLDVGLTSLQLHRTTRFKYLTLVGLEGRTVEDIHRA